MAFVPAFCTLAAVVFSSLLGIMRNSMLFIPGSAGPCSGPCSGDFMNSYFILHEVSGFGLTVQGGNEFDPSFRHSGVISGVIWTWVFLCCRCCVRLRPLSYSILPPEKKS